MSTPQNPYGSDGNNPNGQNPNGQNPNNQNPGNQPPNEPGFGNEQNPGQQPPQYGSQPNYGQQYGQQNDQNQYGQPGDQNQYGSQQNYGQQYGQSNDQNQYGSQPQYGSQSQYGAGNDQYGQNQYDPNAQGYDANQYNQQPAYAGAEGSSDQFIPANPNAGYGQYPAGTGDNTSKNIWGILALIGGIVGFLTSGFIIGGLIGAAAVVFGFIALSAIKKGLASNKGVSITGIILGFVAVLASIVALVIYMFLGVGFLAAIGSAGSSTSPSAAPVDPSQGASQDPAETNGSGSDDGGSDPVSGNEVTIGTDVTVSMGVGPGTTTGIGAESTNDEIAVVKMTVHNNTSSELDLSLSKIEASNDSGKKYDEVFEGTKYRSNLAFGDPVPANGEKTYEFAFAVPSAEVDGVKVKLSLNDDLGKGKDFEFSKQ